MSNIPNKYLYKFLENQLVDSDGTVIASADLTPQITLGQKSTINIQFLNDDLTPYQGLESGYSAQFMVDSDFKNEAQPVPLGNTGWTNTSGSEYAKYLSFEPNTVLFNLVAAVEGTAGSLAEGEYAYNSVSKYVYVRLTGDADPGTLAENYITAKFEVSGATPPFIEVYSDGFNLANSWYDTATETFRDPVITNGELTFYINANTVNFYQRVASTQTVNGYGQVQIYDSGLNIAIKQFTFYCNNRIYGAGESSSILELDGIGYYTKTEADSRFVRLALADAYPSTAFDTGATFYVESASGGSFALSAADLPGLASGEANTASNYGATSGTMYDPFYQKSGVDLQFSRINFTGTGAPTITKEVDGSTTANFAGGAAAGVSTFNTEDGDITLAATGAASIVNTGGSFSLDVPDLQPDITQLEIDRVLTQTGWIDAPLLSVNGGDSTKFDITSGVGVIADWSDPTNPTFIEVNFAGATAQSVTYLTTEYASGILISSAGEIVQNAGVTVPSQYRDYLFVGDLLHNNLTNLNGVQNKPLVQWDSIGSIRDLSLSVGVINTSGNVYSANGTNLQIKKTSGTYYRAGINYESNPNNPNTVTNAAAAPITSFLYGYRDGSGGWIYTSASVIAPNSYDDGDGTLGTVGNNNFTIQRIYNFPNSNQTIILYGQNIYASLSAAITGLRNSFEVDINLRDAALRATLIVAGQTTNLSDTATALFYPADKFGSVSGGTSGGTTSIAHNDLTGLQGGTSGEYYHLTLSEYGDIQALGTASTAATSDFTPIAHVGAGGTAHADASTTASGFMSADSLILLGDVDTDLTAHIGASGSGVHALASTSGSGFLPAFSGVSTQFLNGSGTFSIPSGSLNTENILINSGGSIWIDQRGSIGSAVSAGDYCIDRWQAYHASSGTVTPSLVSGHMRFACTAGSSARQWVGYPYRFGGKTLTLSANVKTSDATDTRLRLYATNGTDELDEYATITATADYSEYSVSGSIPTDATAIYVELYTANAANIDLDWIKLEYGDAPTSYTDPDIIFENIRCLHYCALITYAPGMLCNTTTSMAGVIQYPVTMRTTPAVSALSPIKLSTASATQTQSSASISIIGSLADETAMFVNIPNFTGLTVDDAVSLYDSEILLDAEIY